MSGVCGLFQPDRGPVSPGDLESMAATLGRRGPEGTGLWRSGPVALGHTLLATTAEAVSERLPLCDPACGCAITADARLDNRGELLAVLGRGDPPAEIGDAQLILRAYLAWGESCVERLVGDFAFALWDPRRQALFCARDHLGLKPLYYHQGEGGLFAFASEPRAILALEQVPYGINEGRIADYLVSELEGIDKTSTFFESLYRLAPAHHLWVTPTGVRRRCYWHLEPGPELRLSSNEAYAEAFSEVFTEAVRRRLRSAGPVGSMLSGGLDSSSVVAVAKTLLAEQGRGPLPTFSATAPEPATCIETRTIDISCAIGGIAPNRIHYRQLGELMPDIETLTWNLDEPFDGEMTLLRVLYLRARQGGLKVLLDGVAADILLGEGTYLARLLRRGRWLKACREARDCADYWGREHYPPWRQLYAGARTACAPNVARVLKRRLLGARDARRRVQQCLGETLIGRAFAERIDLAARLRIPERSPPYGLLPGYRQERALALQQTYLTVGRERYDRVASAVGVEPRDPFMDRRLVQFCAGLPGAQRLDGGWPKVILRRAMAGRLPEAVRWRRGKDHLGASFTGALMDLNRERLLDNLAEAPQRLRAFVQADKLRRISADFAKGKDLASSDRFELYQVAQLNAWLARFGQRVGRGDESAETMADRTPWRRY